MKQVVLVLMTTIALGTGAVADIRLASDGKAEVTIGYVPADNEQLKAHAEMLAHYLKRITGATFTLTPGAPSGKGIILVLVRQSSRAAFPELATMGREAHAIRTFRGEEIALGGDSEKAVQNACFDFLHRLGCRWLIPSPRWTVIPKRPTLTVKDMSVVTEPDFAYRSVWYAYGMGLDPSRKVLARDYKLWFDANRLGGVARYKCGHTYPHTVGKHQDEFKAHPEYFAMKEDGTRLPFKRHQSLCYSNPGVADIFIQDKLAELRAGKDKNPYAYTVSMDPNDGSVACHCEPCKALGNGSDQCLHLANQVAKALRKEFPDAVVTFYVYASHRLPPEKVKAEPNINVQVAMGFNRTKYSLEELVRLWRKTVSGIGIRDYFGVMAWDWGLPGRGKASSFLYVKDAIPKYKRWGAISYNSEINANWGSFGPAVYVATKLLWDTEADADAAYDDFFKHAFGKGAEAMKRLHEMWSESTLISRQNLHLWYRQLAKAFAVAKDDSPGVKARLLDMAAYLHYVRLFADWKTAVNARDRERCYEALKPMLEFTWRIRERGMVHAYALQRRLVNSGHPLIRPLEDGWRFNDPKAVWKEPEPLTDGDLLDVYEADLAATPPDSRIRQFSRELVPLKKKVEGRRIGGGLRYNSTWHVLAQKPEHLKFALPMKGVRFSYKLRVYDAGGKLVWQTGHSVASGARYEQKEFSMDIRLPKPGRYRMIFTAGEDYGPIFPEGMKAVLEISQPNHPMIRFFGGYFYVPEGTKEILLKTNGRFSIIQPSARGRRDITARDEDRKRGCVVIPVGKDAGKVWVLHGQSSGRSYFLNIPPYLADNPDALLMPADAEPGGNGE